MHPEATHYCAATIKQQAVTASSQTVKSPDMLTAHALLYIHSHCGRAMYLKCFEVIYIHGLPAVLLNTTVRRLPPEPVFVVGVLTLRSDVLNAELLSGIVVLSGIAVLFGM